MLGRGRGSPVSCGPAPLLCQERPLGAWAVAVPCSWGKLCPLRAEHRGCGEPGSWARPQPCTGRFRCLQCSCYRCPLDISPGEEQSQVCDGHIWVFMEVQRQACPCPSHGAQGQKPGLSVLKGGQVQPPVGIPAGCSQRGEDQKAREVSSLLCGPQWGGMSAGGWPEHSWALAGPCDHLC